MGPNKYNIGDIVNVTSRFKIVGITAENNDIYYELVPCDDYEDGLAYHFGYSVVDTIQAKEQYLRGVAGKYLWGKED